MYKLLGIAHIQLCFIQMIFSLLVLCALLFPVAGHARTNSDAFSFSQGDYTYQMNIPAASTDEELNQAIVQLSKFISSHAAWGQIDVGHVENMIAMLPEILRRPLLKSLEALRKSLASGGGHLPTTLSVPNLRVALSTPLEAEFARRQRETLNP